MNENLVERFGRARKGTRPVHGQAQLWLQGPQLNLQVRQYFATSNQAAAGPEWTQRPELPTSAEILDTDSGSASSEVVEIVPNRPTGAWESKEAYLSAQYELLREDAVRPLREAVTRVRGAPNANEDALGGTIGLYEKVHICAMTCSNNGIALRMTFSLARTGKKILWEQSKRLITGSLVVLTPVNDMFQKTAVVATVAARPLAALDQNPPEIDLFFAKADELEVDPALEWVMVEERKGFYEADRHTLLALQRMMREPFPLSEHVVEANSAVSAPAYVQLHPRADLTSCLKNNKHETYENIDTLTQWPAQPTSELDASQLAALRRLLTKRLAIVQGPPGTGKTHVSVEAVKILLANRKVTDPPILIACQTNHAIDQILRHIAEFEPDFIRLGGMSKDREVIKPRTLYEVKKQGSAPPPAGCLGQIAKKKMKQLEKDIALLLAPLKPDKIPLDFRMLEKLALITEKQADSLEAGASEWVHDRVNPDVARSPFTSWLGHALITVPLKQQPEEFGFEYEEADLAFEQLKELEAENVTKDDEDFETLSGTMLPLADNFTCRKLPGMTSEKAKAALKEQDMWKIPEAARGAVYRYLQAEAKKHIVTAFRDKAKRFNEEAMNSKIGRWEQDEIVLKKQKIIGLTTTGLSKYRGLLASLRPKIVLIEEAAETLEAPVTVTCLPSLQHLMLVGDHKQLRPHCHVQAHENKPFYLNVSLFERLVNNGVEFATLSKQRRMIPEIRRLLYPIYGNLIKDHASVLDPDKRPNVPGMGGVNSFFFTHQWPEQRDENMSTYNADEADMIVGFLEYLVYNGVQTEDVTVLTFYNGQRKRLLASLRHRQTGSLTGRRFNVVTVDSYQGEENEIVILSLVRSNDKGQIGFLEIDNRVCVALSRARCGFYIFGNGMLLYQNKNSTWSKVIDIIAAASPKKRGIEAPKMEPVSRLAEALPLRCSNHNAQTLVEDPAGWEGIMGGCQRQCIGHLPCGHKCELKCHPFAHDEVNCHRPCGKALSCGHGPCAQRCGEICACKLCQKARGRPLITGRGPPSDGKDALSRMSSPESWKSFAEREPIRYATAASGPISARTSPSKSNLSSDLLELSVEDEDDMKIAKYGLGARASPSVPVVELPTMGEEVRAAVKETPDTSNKEDWSQKKSLLDLD